MIQTHGYAAYDAEKPLAPFSFTRRDVGPKDVRIDILYCGVCHSDLHTVKAEWGGPDYPCVPGHEIVGRVVETGKEVKGFKTGDMVGVGCLVDSCQQCEPCSHSLEQYCQNGFTGTYGGTEKETGQPTRGGYSDKIVVNEKFVLRVPENLDPAAAAPLLCAGITTYSPLRHWKVGKGSKVGVVGLGGLGHMAVKLAHAMGAYVVVFTTSPGKEEDAKKLGADDVVVSKDKSQMAKYQSKLDYIINSVSAPHSLDDFMVLLKLDGTMTMLGVPPKPHASPSVGNLIFQRRSLSGSLIGGLAETQEMLDFCGKHGITSDVEIIPMDQINEAYERMLKSDVKYRFVIDMSTLPKAA